MTELDKSNLNQAMIRIVNAVREASDQNPSLRSKIASGLLGLAHAVCVSNGINTDRQCDFLREMDVALRQAVAS